MSIIGPLGNKKVFEKELKIPSCYSGDGCYLTHQEYFERILRNSGVINESNIKKYSRRLGKILDLDYPGSPWKGRYNYGFDFINKLFISPISEMLKIKDALYADTSMSHSIRVEIILSLYFLGQALDAKYSYIFDRHVPKYTFLEYLQDVDDCFEMDFGFGERNFKDKKTPCNHPGECVKLPEFEYW